MNRYIKPALLFLTLFLFLTFTYGQDQINFDKNITGKFLKYCEAIPREEIFVHTDRDEYIAGEDIWFNIYLIDRQNNKPSENSKIAYVELLNSENRPVVQKRIRLDKGFGPGQIVLPDSLSNGIYTIRAYTNWMKNFLPDNCFMKNMNIYNALSTKVVYAKSDYNVIINKGYNAEKEREPDDAGLAMKVNNLRTDTLEIFISANKNYRSANGNLFYLFIQTHGIINHISTERTAGTSTIITLPKKELIPGINQITIFDSKGQPLCERFIYTPVKKKKYLTLKSADSFKTREKIILEIDSGKELATILNTTNLSISVAPETDSSEMMDLSDYMIFGSEFGTLPLRSFNKAKINELSVRLTDSILSTVKSNWIDWKAILSDTLPVLRYRIEKKDNYLSGKLLNSKTQAPKSGRILFLSTPGKVATIQYTRTDDDGNFSFNIQIEDGVKDIIIQPEEIENSTIKIESPFLEKYPETERATNTLINNIPTNISQLKVNYQVSKIYGSSAQGDPLTPSVLSTKPVRFYGKPDIELFMTDYINLPVMQEVFYELLPGVSLKNRKSGYEISIADPVSNEVFDKKPLLLIDGAMIDDPSILANLDPEIVEKIDVVKEKYMVGDYSFYGMVNVITKKGDYSCVALPDYAIRMSYRVIEPVWSFVSPDYSSTELKNSRIPDFRNTLYWNPSVKPDKEGKVRVEFWSSNIVSDYEINIQGITSEGKTFSLKKIIRVK